jgi:hypothetical protein
MSHTLQEAARQVIEASDALYAKPSRGRLDAYLAALDRLRQESSNSSSDSTSESSAGTSASETERASAVAPS